jgi:hypothetical protein
MIKNMDENGTAHALTSVLPNDSVDLFLNAGLRFWVTSCCQHQSRYANCGLQQRRD